jgi:8-oxo-dGTP diphosphatase
MSSSTPLPYKISVLVFLRDKAGKFLLIQRKKSPNLGCWSPIGGKLETTIGESPFECAVREVEEEVGKKITTDDLHLFGMISEKGYEGQNHWLMFLFTCRQPIEGLPPTIDEGHFDWFSRKEIDTLAIPESDKIILWPIFDKHQRDFISYRAECNPGSPLKMIIEETQQKPNLD